MAYRCNPCRHTSAPFPIARSEWDMKQNAHFCPDCQNDYIISTQKYPNHPSPQGNCNCGCQPCCCRPACNIQKPILHPTVNPCFPPHPAIPPHVVPPHPVPPHVVPAHPTIPPHPVPSHVVPPQHHPAVPHPIVPHNPGSPPHLTPVPQVHPAATSFFL